MWMHTLDHFSLLILCVTDSCSVEKFAGVVFPSEQGIFDEGVA